MGIFIFDMMMTEGKKFILQNQELYLLPQKAIWLAQHQTLLLSDVHFGKVGHFRKSGIAIPEHLIQEDLAILSDLIEEFCPKQIIFLGDLFHSEINNDWQWFSLWRNLHPQVALILVEGNHDIIDHRHYKELNIDVYKEYFLADFHLVHIPPRQKTDKYCISGHIHPSVKLKGKGRQFLSVPCFFFNEYQGILPAFGKFTGLASINIKPNDHVFAVTGCKIVPIKTN